MTDILEIKQSLQARAAEVSRYLLPGGISEGHEWRAGSVAGEAGKSLGVHLDGAKAGTWCDFATGESGDLLDLWRAVRGCDLSTALTEASDWIGVKPAAFIAQPRKEYRRPAKPKCHAPKSAVREYLTGERKLTPAAIASYRVAEDGRTIVFPYILPDGTLAFVKYLGLDRPGGKKAIHAEADCEPVLFGWQAIDANSREVTITEGEIDACTAWDYGLPALSVPFGGGRGAKQAWIETEFDRLARFETIFLALDMDEEGEKAVAEITARLGRHRCRRVQLPRKDLNECRKDGISAEEIRVCFANSATQDPTALRNATVFRDGVAALLWPAGGAEPGYTLPFEKLRDKMRFRPNEFTVWSGATGHGKSMVLSHAMLDFATQGARMCVASLEMAPTQTLRRMIFQACNTSNPTTEFFEESMRWFGEWMWLVDIVGKCKLEDLLDIFDYARCRYGCDVFVIDSLMRLGLGNEDYEGQEKAIFKMVEWSTRNAVHLHLVAHGRKKDQQSFNRPPDPDDVKGASEITANAFNVLSVFRDRKLERDIEDARKGAEHGDAIAAAKLRDIGDLPTVILDIPKQRNGNWDGRLPLWFDRETLRYRQTSSNRDELPYIQLDRRRSVPAEADADADDARTWGNY